MGGFMEFLFGFALALLTIFAARHFIIDKEISWSRKSLGIRYTQSYIFELLYPSMSYKPLYKTRKPSQSLLNEEKNKQRIIFTDNKAYWIKDNAFYEASLIDGEVDKTTTKVVDTMTMDKVELDKMIFIVQKLTEGMKNDFGNPGI
jgi:hypothetical protein